MVHLDTVHAINRELVQSQKLVAVFTGGTGGIGPLSLKALATAVAKHNGQGLRAYLVGRNADAAEKIIKECRVIYEAGEYHYIKVEDLSLVEQVDKACAEIISCEERNASAIGETARIDFLLLSHGGTIFLPRQDTKEGLDGTMARFYYSRIAFITSLMPLVLRSSLPAAVVSIYAAGMEGKLYPDDLSLRDLSHYNYSQARSHACYMHTLVFEELAKRHQGKLRFTHIYPGLVVHEGMGNPTNPWWIRILFTKVLPFLGVDVDLEESGARMVSLASPSYYPPQRLDSIGEVSSSAIAGTDGQPGSGSYMLTWNGESCYAVKKYASVDKDALRQKLWDHSNAVLEVIRAGKVFTE
ncbi:Short-chain dehydrogenase/reductase SAT2 [Colletotrichum siamense]|uniref:Short-chain dehydrogenase/reductase SAT2 n=1 Tax=Colletotrichum siamense TaxID=690259 RepID=UPI001872A2CC|nr:Short-chain dehydrogenase/reductase SAT2 [Colletotrichum siamense]KAF5501392.1 Short-chain dehydrogenase/reductase SAT2 [Colletotrichum siamense]